MGTIIKNHLLAKRRPPVMEVAFFVVRMDLGLEIAEHPPVQV